jgi:purine-nucleoside phosphorylase
MTKFQKLFGINESEIRETCVVAPFLTKDLLKYFGIKELARGKLYAASSAGPFSLINTGMGPAFTGDAVLYLEKTPCKDIILFGSCGLVSQKDTLDIGSLVTPYESCSLESFSDILKCHSRAKLVPAKAGSGNPEPRQNDNKRYKFFEADKTLIEEFLKSRKKTKIQKVRCATMGSLKLEENLAGFFKQKNIEILDMECSALFSASKLIKKRAMALFYVRDIIGEKPFYEALKDEEKTALSSSIESAAHIICEFIKKIPNV